MNTDHEVNLLSIEQVTKEAAKLDQEIKEVSPHCEVLQIFKSQKIQSLSKVIKVICRPNICFPQHTQYITEGKRYQFQFLLFF